MLRNILRNTMHPPMRSVPSAEAARTFGATRESVIATCAEPVAVTHYNVPKVVAMSDRDHKDLLRKARFAGKLADLPDDDLTFLATRDQRNG